VTDAHVEVIKGMEPFVEESLGLLRDVKESWQPSDVLPDLSGENWQGEIEPFRQRAQALPDGIFIVLVGNTITEEALPSYQSMLTRHEGVGDRTGTSDNPWARWTRGWTAEENRHGELLGKYLYLSGRVNVRSVEVTTQNLIRSGFNPGTENDPYRGLIYTSFQERATRISHGNTGRLANQAGDAVLGKICNLVAGDESRHEEAYKRFVGEIVRRDPTGAVCAFSEMMKKRITMPARLMSDGESQDLFGRFAAVAQRIGVYTARDYADILEHLLTTWGIPGLTGLSGESAEAQDSLCGLPQHYRAFADKVQGRLDREAQSAFPWIFNRPA